MKRHSSISFVAALLGTVVALSPASTFAQNTDPMTPSAPGVGPQRPQPGSSMQDSNGSLGTTADTMKDKMFLRKAAAGGLAEVELGQLASKKAQSPDVKAFAEKMVADHTAINEQMKVLADAMSVPFPKKMNKEDQAEYDKLNSLSGPDFDTEYITFMVKDHHKDLREFHEEAQYASDPNLKEAVMKAGRVIHQHTKMVDKIAKDKGIPVPESNPNSKPAV